MTNKWKKIKEENPPTTLCVFYITKTEEFIIGKVVKGKVNGIPLKQFSYWQELERP